MLIRKFAMLFSLPIIVISALVLTSCNAAGQPAPPQTDGAANELANTSEAQGAVTAVTAALKAEGATVNASLNQQWANTFNDLFERDVSNLWDLDVNGEQVHVYVFEDATTTQTAANSISRSGDSFRLIHEDGTGIIMNVDYEAGSTPRYWKQDEFIIYYTGQNSATLDLLDAAFGARIADGDLPDQPYEPGQAMAGMTLAGISLRYDPYLAAGLQLEPYPTEDNPTQLRLVMESLNLHESAFTPMVIVARDDFHLDELVSGDPLADGLETVTFQNGSGQSWVMQADNGEAVYVALGQTDDERYTVAIIYPVVASGNGYTPDPALLDDVFASLNVEAIFE